MNKYKYFNIIKSQYSTEKTFLISDKFNGITFKVNKDSNKIEIKNFIKKFFNVEVDSVKIINVKGKSIRFKNSTGKQKNWKKAIVFIKKGFSINFQSLNSYDNIKKI